ncbi:MAG: EMC3/TMCO1 family protein [Candidatus Diapherotrites archaeon]
MVFFDVMLEIALVAMCLAVVSQIVRRKFVDPKKMKEQQKVMKEKQAKIKELVSKEDAKSKAELQRIQTEMLEVTNEMMQGSMRMMMFTFPVYIVAFWGLGYLYSTAVIDLPIQIPWFGENWSIKFYEQTNWIGWYVLISLITGLALGFIFNALEKIKGEQ